MSIDIVLCAMEEDKQYFPGQVPCDLTRPTQSKYLRELWHGGVVERSLIDNPEKGRGHKKKRVVYISRQKRLDLG